jgi:hypothetical protein
MTTKPKANDKLTYMPDVTACLTKVQEKGFTDQYQAKGTHLYCLDNNRIYHPEDITVANYYRFEGLSDPDDMAILYAIETSDGRKGTLIDAYGYHACEEVGDFMIAVENIHKKMPRHNWKPVVPVE